VTFLRTLVVLACAPLTACNTLVSAPRHIADFGSVISSYTHLDSDSSDEMPGGDLSARPPDLARQIVPLDSQEPPGTILIRTNERRLYFLLADGKAIRYPVGVGRSGKQWQGRAEIDGAYVKPAWSPTPEIKRDSPNLPDVIPGGAHNNPMGARALTLSGGEYAIHGTNRPETIGTYASYGCIRMFNQDIIDLFGRVSVGTQVVVTL
jgi:lipoprotein-anchoring transpeptidase ErfK/SrfK